MWIIKIFELGLKCYLCFSGTNGNRFEAVCVVISGHLFIYLNFPSLKWLCRVSIIIQFKMSLIYCDCRFNLFGLFPFWGHENYFIMHVTKGFLLFRKSMPVFFFCFLREEKSGASDKTKKARRNMLRVLLIIDSSILLNFAVFLLEDMTGRMDKV